MATTLVPHDGLPRTGRLVVTDDQLVFVDEVDGPVAMIPRADIYAVVNERRFRGRDRMRVKTTSGDLLFSEGYREIGRLLKACGAWAAA